VLGASPLSKRPKIAQGYLEALRCFAMSDEMSDHFRTVSIQIRLDTSKSKLSDSQVTRCRPPRNSLTHRSKSCTSTLPVRAPLQADFGPLQSGKLTQYVFLMAEAIALRLFIVSADLTMKMACDLWPTRERGRLIAIGGIRMRDRQNMIARKAWAAIATMLVLVSGVLGQAQRPPVRAPLRNEGGTPLKKARPEAGDPLANARGAGQLPTAASSHYTFRLRSFDGTPLAASYYPSHLGNSSPVVMLIHEMGRSRKDFEDPVQDLRGQGLAAHLQGLGFAVFCMDLRWQGQNPRRALSTAERPKLIEDLQAGFFFLVDRHNRGDFNLGKLGVVALGDGANLAVAWAMQPGAAITIEGKPSDLNALALISPNPEGFGYVLRHGITALAPRVPLLLVAGERDNPSKDTVQSVRQIVQRARLNKIGLFPSSLHGYKLLRLEPKVTSALIHFLDATLKNKPVEWEPQYNLTPISFGDSQLVLNDKQAENAKKKSKNAPLNPEKKSQAPQNEKVEKADPKQSKKDIPPAPHPKSSTNKDD
jgi:hypothetical protein